MPDKKWKKLSTKKLFSHPRITIYEDDVRLPNGHETKYLHFGETNDAAMVIAVGNDGKVFAQKEYSYPPNEWLYQFPGGLVDDDESPDAGALREFAEEAGMTGDIELLGWLYLDNRRKSSKFYVYIARNIHEATATKDAEEEFENFWFTVQEIDTMIANGEITNYSFLAAWAIFKSKTPS